MKTFSVLAALLALSTAAFAPVAAQTPEVDAVLDKAGDYVTVYERTFVGEVTEETYRQDVRGRSGNDPRGFAVEGPRQRRDLRSDMLLVRAVPREMREKYALQDGSTIEGKASYARFRRYPVKVDEKIVPIK
jgi:hypothetical protein